MTDGTRGTVASGQNEFWSVFLFALFVKEGVIWFGKWPEIRRGRSEVEGRIRVWKKLRKPK